MNQQSLSYNLAAACLNRTLRSTPPSTPPRVHDRPYVASIVNMSDDHSKGIHRVGDESGFAPGGFEIAALSAGGAIVATEEVLSGQWGA